MKKTKLLLGSLVAACAFSACSVEEEIGVVGPEATSSARPQINLVLGSSVADTRLGVNSAGDVTFTTNDELGAVLVDAGYSATGYKNVNWDIISGHAAHNKWTYESGKFTTEGTTAVGAWLFYSQYNEAMTKTRNGVEFSFPQIQDGAADFSKLANNNINFFTTPVMLIDGAEGETVDLPLEYASVYNNLEIKLSLPAGVESVEKILVYANDGSYKFPAKYRLANENIPVAKMSVSVDAPGGVQVVNHAGAEKGQTGYTLDKNDQKVEAYQAMAAMSGITVPYNRTSGYGTPVFNWNVADYVALSEPVGNEAYDYLVVDCGTAHTDFAAKNVVDGKFSTYMLMPAGVYNKLTLKIYTNKGIYTKDVVGYDHYKENQKNQSNQYLSATATQFILKPNATTPIANIKKVENVEAYDYLKVSSAVDNSNSDFIVTQTSDLISFIKGIKDKNKTYNVKILPQAEHKPYNDAAIEKHALVINADVMAAIVGKESTLGGDIQLVFENYNGNAAIEIEGTDAGLTITDMTFNENCVVTKGKVLVGEQIEATNMTVKPAAAVEIKANQKKNQYDVWSDLKDSDNTTISTLVVEAGASASVDGLVKLSNVTNKGTFTAATGSELKVGALVNDGTVTADGKILEVALTNNKNAVATFNNDATLTGVSVNKGTINVNESLTVAANTTNENQVVIADGAELIVSGANRSGAEFKNVVVKDAQQKVVSTGTIVNYGSMMTNIAEPTNVINNLAVIEAKAGSTTYITTNSSDDEYKVTTSNSPSYGGGYPYPGFGGGNQTTTTISGNTVGVIMGTIKMDERDSEMSVANLTKQGYKEYTVKADDLTAGVFAPKTGDKFNKVVFTSAATLSADFVATEAEGQYLNFVEAAANLTLPESIKLQELTFTADAVLYAPKTSGKRATVACLSINQNASVQILTDNALYVGTVATNNVDKGYQSRTEAMIANAGSLTVGGILYTSLTKNQAEDTSAGKFYSGNANSYQWNQEQ